MNEGWGGVEKQVNQVVEMICNILKLQNFDGLMIFFW